VHRECFPNGDKLKANTKEQIHSVSEGLVRIPVYFCICLQSASSSSSKNKLPSLLGDRPVVRLSQVYLSSKTRKSPRPCAVGWSVGSVVHQIGAVTTRDDT
jgi:hypothetical protein